MDDNIQVCAVYQDGEVRVYAARNNGVRRLLEVLKFSTYGHAIQFAQEFEALERTKPVRRQ